jgi:DNA (cytosine-5)-methyltransferase 1
MNTLCATNAEKWGSNQWVKEGKAVLQPIARAENTIGRKPENGGNGDGFTEEGPMYTLNATGVHGVAQPIAFSGQMSVPQTDVDMTQTLQAKNPMAVAVGTDLYNGNITGDVAATMGTPGSSVNASGPTVMQSMAVRRLTPVECERLQGFPDSYTDIKSKNKPTPDGPRYKALGNSMAVPVMAWIGQRIEQVEAICKQNK